jgi:hypothetical protein
MDDVIARLQPLSALYPLGFQKAASLVQSTEIRCAMDCILDAMRQYDLDPLFETPFDVVRWDDAHFALEALLLATFPEAFALACFNVMADAKSVLVYEAGKGVRQQVCQLLACEPGSLNGLSNLLKGFVLVYHFVFGSRTHPVATLVDAYNVLLAIDRVFARHWDEVTVLYLRYYMRSFIRDQHQVLLAKGLREIALDVDKAYGRIM